MCFQWRRPMHIAHSPSPSPFQPTDMEKTIRICVCHCWLDNRPMEGTLNASECGLWRVCAHHGKWTRSFYYAATHQHQEDCAQHVSNNLLQIDSAKKEHHRQPTHIIRSFYLARSQPLRRTSFLRASNAIFSHFSSRIQYPMHGILLHSHIYDGFSLDVTTCDGGDDVENR